MLRSDDDLLRDLRRGENAALAMLYHRHKGALYRFALRVAGETAIAEDAIHAIAPALGGLLFQAGGPTAPFWAWSVLMGAIAITARWRLR